MKKLLIIAVVLFFSCSENKKPIVNSNVINSSGKIEVKNGKHENVTINYSTNALEKPSFADTYGKEPRIIRYDFFVNIVNQSVNHARETCKYPLTFEPTKIGILIQEESEIYTIVDFIASNGFGVPIEGTIHIQFNKDKVIRVTDNLGNRF